MHGNSAWDTSILRMVLLVILESYSIRILKEFIFSSQSVFESRMIFTVCLWNFLFIGERFSLGVYAPI